MPSTLIARPHSSEYAPFFQGYISSVPEGDLLTVLRDGSRELQRAVSAIPESRGGFRYAEGKWTIREVVGHIIDTERILSYRTLRIARGDATPLPAFEEDDYVRSAGSDERSLASLVHELSAVQESSALLLESLPSDAWTRRGITSNKEISVRALAYVIAGHPRHHLRLLRERYLIG